MKKKFYTEVWFMWLMLFVFAPVGIILLAKYHNNSKFKKSLISVLFIFVFLIEICTYVGIGASSNQSVASNLPKKSVQKVIYKKLSASDRELLKMKYSDFSDDKKTQFSNIEAKYGELSTKDQASISDNYQRLENEKKGAESAQSQPNQNNSVQNSTPPAQSQPQPEQQQNPTVSQEQQGQHQSQQQNTQNAQPNNQTVQQPEQNQNQGETVYITNTGKKYHRAGCKYLRRSQIQISLKDAKAQGYTPCEICNP